jgi:hypothetical protein
MIIKRLLSIALFFIAANASAAPVTYYVCNTGGSDTNSGLQISAPLATYSAGIGKILSATVPEGGFSVLFCRGGAFTSTAATSRIRNNTGSATKLITIGDYYIPGQPLNAPKPIIYTPQAAAYGLYFNNSGTTGADGWYVVKNLNLIGQGGAPFGIYLTFGVDNVIIDNVEISGFGAGVSLSYSSTKITGVSGTSGTAILTTTGTWGTTAAGNAVVGEGIPTGTYVQSVDSTTQITLNQNLTSDLNNYVEVGGSVNNLEDPVHNNIKITNSYFHDNRLLAGVSGNCSQCVISGNRFDNNGWASSSGTGYHNIYISAELRAQDIEISKNTISRAQMRDGKCQAVSVVAHGVIDNIDIVNNNLWEDAATAGATCFGIAVGPGSYAGVVEKFTNVSIDNNILYGFGNVGISCDSCRTASISGNTLFSTSTNKFTTVIQVGNADEVDYKSDAVSVNDNYIQLSCGATKTCYGVNSSVYTGTNLTVTNNKCRYSGAGTANCFESPYNSELTPYFNTSEAD